MRTPSIQMSPWSGMASRLMQRSNVLLPEPDAPISEHDLMLGGFERDAFQHFEIDETLMDLLNAQIGPARSALRTLYLLPIIRCPPGNSFTHAYALDASVIAHPFASI